MIIKAEIKKKKGIMVYDIETERFNNETKKNPEKLGFICGVVYEIDTSEYYIFQDPSELCKLLNRATRIVGYNNIYFDDTVLLKYGGINDFIERCDLLVHCRNQCDTTEIKWPKLDELMKVNFNIKKPKYNHDDKDELIEHCRQDVEYTYKLYELLISQGFEMPEVKSKQGKKYFGEDLILQEAWFDNIPKGKVEVDCPHCNKPTIALYSKRTAGYYGNDGFYDDMSEGQMADYGMAMMSGDETSDWYIDSYSGICQHCKQEFESINLLG